MNRARLRCLLAALLVAATVAACSTGSARRLSSGGKLSVVAAEDFWGSLARQLGGERVEVTSIVTNPDSDPHDYEPTPADARAVASAHVVILNGIGYDPWCNRLIKANPSSARAVLNVGDLAGLKPGANPHQWYSPAVVDRVIGQLTADYQKLDPAHAAYFDQQRSGLESAGLADYHALISDIRTRYAGTPIGASESIVTPLAAALGLNVITPGAFLDAISEGNEPSAADKAVVDQQLVSRAVKVFLFNSQNATPDVRRLVESAKANGIAVATVTETLVPRGATFQAWQTTQLRDLEAALAAGAGR